MKEIIAGDTVTISHSKKAVHWLAIGVRKPLKKVGNSKNVLILKHKDTIRRNVDIFKVCNIRPMRKV